MRKIVLAIDSFKGSLTSAEAEAAALEGIRRVYPQAEIVCIPPYVHRKCASVYRDLWTRKWKHVI